MEYKWLHSRDQKRVRSVLALVEGEKIISVEAYIIRQDNGSWVWRFQIWPPRFGGAPSLGTAMEDVLKEFRAIREFAKNHPGETGRVYLDLPLPPPEPFKFAP